MRAPPGQSHGTSRSGEKTRPSGLAPAVTGGEMDSTWSKSILGRGSEQRTPVGLSNHPAYHTWQLIHATSSSGHRDPPGSDDRAVRLGAYTRPETAPCPGITRVTGNHTAVQPQRGPSTSRESRLVATSPDSALPLRGSAAVGSAYQVRLRSESPRPRTTADPGSMPGASARDRCGLARRFGLCPWGVRVNPSTGRDYQTNPERS